MNETQIVVLTASQLQQIVQETVMRTLNANADAQPQQNETKQFVYGLRGIRQLFNVSHTTAQRYKNTFLAPAIMQRGRNIVVDVEKALNLYNQTISQ